MNDQKNKIFIILVGGGKVSTGYTNGKLTHIPNHLSAIKSIENTKVVLKAVVEKNIKIRNFLVNKGIKAYKNIDDIKYINKNDIFVICTPPKDRLLLIKKCNKFKIRNLILEKPLSEKFIESIKIKEYVHKYKINLFTNYHRRNIKTLVELKRKLKDCVAINVHYNNGLLNYASHAIDLINFYFGKLIYVQGIKNENKKNNKLNNSYSFYGILKKNIFVNFQSYEKVNYDLLDLEFICKNKKIVLKTGGSLIIEEKPIKNLYYKGYNHLKSIKEHKKNSEGFKELYLNLYNFVVNNNKTNFCNIENSCYVTEVCEKVIKSVKNGRKQII